MKSRSIQIALSLTLVLAVFLLVLSCGPAPQNQNQNQNQAQNQAGNRAGNDAGANQTGIAPPDDPCTQTTPAGKKDKLKEKVLEKIDNDPVLRKQYHGYGHYPPGYQHLPPRFKFDVAIDVYDNVEIHFKGDISGPGKLEALVDSLKPYMKKGCLEKVTFTSLSSTADDWEWTFCEWPTVSCGGGICANPPCPQGTVPPRNDNANANANANANSNSNGRRGNQ